MNSLVALDSLPNFKKIKGGGILEIVRLISTKIKLYINFIVFIHYDYNMYS